MITKALIKYSILKFTPEVTEVLESRELQKSLYQNYRPIRRFRCVKNLPSGQILLEGYSLRKAEQKIKTNRLLWELPLAFKLLINPPLSIVVKDIVIAVGGLGFHY